MAEAPDKNRLALTVASGEKRMDVFELHKNVIDDYAAYTRSFIRISDERIADAVQQEISEGLLWPEPVRSN